MAAAPFDLRMPRLEGHLVLNTASLSDSPQTSNRTAWSEKWCSLEDGRLLVYHDRTAAIVAPDEPVCTIDLRSFGFVQPASSSADALHVLVLSCTPLEPLKSSRLFRPKSALSLNRLHFDSAPRDPFDREPRPSTNSSLGRVSFQALSSGRHSPLVDVQCRSPQASNSWAKLRSGSRKLYAKVATSSTSLRTLADGPVAVASATSSINSVADATDFTEITSSGAPSPLTPHSYNFSPGYERVFLRAASLDAFESWLEALSRTFRLLQEDLDSMPAHLLRTQRVSSRPSLSNLPGFRTPASLTSSPLLSSVDGYAMSVADDTTPKAVRKRVASSASLGWAVGSSRALQQAASDRSGGLESAPFFPGLTAAECMHPRAELVSATRAQAMGPPDTNHSRLERKHKRSISTASSSLSISGSGKLSITRRNSISSAHLLSPSSRHARPATAEALPPSSRQLVFKRTGDATPSEAVGGGPVAMATPGAGVSTTRHRRSGSVLRFGSARILGWRDNSAVSETLEAQKKPVGLGLEVGGRDQSLGSLDTRRHESMRGLAKLKSFRLLPKSSVETGGGSGSPAPHCILQDGHTARPDQVQEGMGKKARGMSRTSSLLSLTRHTFSSLRDRSRPSVKHTFATPASDAYEQATQMGSPVRVQTADGDFSYELVQPAGPADCDATSDLAPPIEGAAASGMSAYEELVQPDASFGMHTDASREETALGLEGVAERASGSVTASPLAVERILPPEQMIHAFDQLRASDPERSCDWLGRIETAARRGSVDWAAASAGRQRALRPAASQSFAVRAGSVDLDALARAAEGPRLRTSISAWDLPAAKRDGEHSPAQQRPELLPELEQDENVGRSLPAPPRASKRRALVSAATPRGASLRALQPLGERTNRQLHVAMPNLGDLKLVEHASPVRRTRLAQSIVTA